MSDSEGAYRIGMLDESGQTPLKSHMNVGAYRADLSEVEERVLIDSSDKTAKTNIPKKTLLVLRAVTPPDDGTLAPSSRLGEIAREDASVSQTMRRLLGNVANGNKYNCDWSSEKLSGTKGSGYRGCQSRRGQDARANAGIDRLHISTVNGLT